MGTGVDIVYPAAHSRLADEILAGGGALVSQFPDGTVPRRQNFPARNWTMAALSDLVVVVEAGEGSGALITAEAALHLHKEVMAVPGQRLLGAVGRDARAAPGRRRAGAERA